MAELHRSGTDGGDPETGGTDRAQGDPGRAPYSKESFALNPTWETTFLRTFLPWQLIRFASINLKMLRMIGISHGKKRH